MGLFEHEMEELYAVNFRIGFSIVRISRDPQTVFVSSFFFFFSLALSFKICFRLNTLGRMKRYDDCLRRFFFP